MYLGIDLGTSAIKVVLLDEDQTLVAQASAALTVANPQPLWSEQDPEAWWHATCAAMTQLQGTHAHQLSQVRAIGLSGQMHGATLLDKHDRVLRPAILWNDGRAWLQCQQLVSKVPHYAKITGNQIMPGFTAPKLLWVAQHEPDTFAQVAKVLLPKDYLRLRMTHTYATDMSDAAGTMWLNVSKRQWSEDMLAATNLSLAHMPTLFEGSDPTAQVTPTLAQQWGIPPTTVVVGGAGDNAAAAVSVNVLQPGHAFLSLGTSGVYFVAGDAYHTNPNEGVHSFCHCLPNRWHEMTVHLSAASCLHWLSGVLHAPVADLLQEAEHSQPDHDPVIFLPYLSGERTPHNDPHARGVFFGMSHTTQRADLTRAVLEGVAFALADGQDAMLHANTSIQHVSVVGGGARSLYWGNILASVLNRPLTYCQDREAGAALGAARLAWLGVHDVDPLQAFARPPIEKIIEPNPTWVEPYHRKRELFRQLYQRLHPIFNQIAEIGHI